MTLQRLVDRDAEYLEPGLEAVDVVVGFDGAADFTHVCLRLVNYKADVSKESAMKGVGLAVAMGNDHNENLGVVFQRLGPAINEVSK